MRDLQKDLEICQLANAAPWTVRDYSIYNGERLVADYVPRQRDCYFITAAREGWPEAIKRAMAAEAKVRELETQCAAMREALLKINELGNCDKCGQTYVLHDIAEIKHQALSSDAGKAMLKRMAKLEAVAEAAKKCISGRIPWCEPCYRERICGQEPEEMCAVYQLKKALAELEEGNEDGVR